MRSWGSWRWDAARPIEDVPRAPADPATGPGALDPALCAVAEPSPGRAPLRRLTVDEYDHTVSDLLGDTTRPALRLVDDERGVVSADARIITPLLAEQ